MLPRPYMVGRLVRPGSLFIIATEPRASRSYVQAKGQKPVGKCSLNIEQRVSKIVADVAADFAGQGADFARLGAMQSYLSH
ncbi:MAG TPA: hypothetical protein DD437_10885 [Rhodobiaceae bacterium]|nr:hypothetical protein [Rhodobiaceae bacterium]